MSAIRSLQRFLIRGPIGSNLAFELKTPASLWRMNYSKEINDGCTSNGTEFSAADIRALSLSLLPFGKQ